MFPPPLPRAIISGVRRRPVVRPNKSLPGRLRRKASQWNQTGALSSRRSVQIRVPSGFTMRTENVTLLRRIRVAASFLAGRPESLLPGIDRDRDETLGRDAMAGELWSTDLQSGRTEPVLPGVHMARMTISSQGDTVAYVTVEATFGGCLSTGERPRESCLGLSYFSTSCISGLMG